MKVIIAGSRTITDYGLVEKAVRDAGFTISEVVSGKAKGVDTLGEQWAKAHGVPVKEFPAHWELGKSAGYRRNLDMAKYADALILIHNGSKGSTHMKNLAIQKGLRVYEVRI